MRCKWARWKTLPTGIKSSRKGVSCLDDQHHPRDVPAHRWRLFVVDCDAPDGESAIKRAIEEFKVPPQQRERLMAAGASKPEILKLRPARHAT
jgi:hypothetical protein